MLPEALTLRPAQMPIALSPAWAGALRRLGLAWLLLSAVTASDWGAMIHQWWTISTYTHILLIPGMLGWMVCQRAPVLARLSPCAWGPGIGLFGAAALLWLAGRLAGITEASEAGAVAMLAAAVPALLGPRIALGLAFPLFYMAFLVPVGDELVPVLQNITAALTILLVHATGVRASIDGVFINTPAGLFQIAEACSGVKFLVAMVAFGAFAANQCFLSWRRRSWFMAACIVVPVLANGVRAWGTVFAAQFVGAAAAGGIDHLIYGWIFFALVISAVIGGAWHWFDRPAGAPMIDEAQLANRWVARAEAFALPPLPALAGVAAVALVAAGWSAAADGLAAALPRHVDLPAVPGWHRVNYAPRHWWEPRAAGADHRLLGAYANAAGDEVDIFYALYAGQGPGRKAGAMHEGAVGEGTGWAWQAPGPAVTGALSERLLTAGPVARLAETTYRTGALTTGSVAVLRLAGFGDKVLLRARPTAMLILSSEERPGHPAAPAIAAFRQAVGDTGAWMDALALPR